MKNEKEEELNTLNDLDINYIGYDNSCDETERDDREWILKDDIKEAAIEWINTYKRKYIKIPSGCSFNDSLTAKIDFIMEFFNITNEDLSGDRK